jgi:hypothetical protein
LFSGVFVGDSFGVADESPNRIGAAVDANAAASVLTA